MIDDEPPANDPAPVWRREEIDSPCVRICAIHPGAGVCVGCHRTAEEITRWSGYSESERAAIRDALPNRAALLRAPSARPSRRRRLEQNGTASSDQAEDL